MNSVLLVLSALAIQAGQAPAGKPAQANAVPRDVSALLEPIRAKHDVPGLVAALVSHGKVEALGAAGVRRRGGEERITVDDRFHLGSCTKAMTATLCAILVDRGELAWDARVTDGLADDAAKARPAWKEVRLAHLLTNRGGAPAELDANGLWSRLFASKESPLEQRHVLARGVFAAEPVAAPGEQYVYSNAGFSLAGAMAERAAKLDYEALMRRELFTPLGMESAGFGPPGANEAKDKSSQPWGHTAEGTPVAPADRGADNPAAIAPAGRVHCTISDWARFVALHLDAENGKPRLASAESFARLHAPAEGPGERYAMGWIVAERPWAGGTVLTHSGSNTMWFAVAWLAPKKDFALLACSNQGGDAAAKACDEAVSTLLRSRP